MMQMDLGADTPAGLAVETLMALMLQELLTANKTTREERTKVQLALDSGFRSEELDDFLIDLLEAVHTVAQQNAAALLDFILTGESGNYFTFNEEEED